MFTKSNDLWNECFKDFDEDTYCGLTLLELTNIYIEWLQAVVEENNEPCEYCEGENKGECMQHTKEPWIAVAVDDGYEVYSVVADYDVAWGIDCEANAERIVACVNACVGITNEALENGVIKEAMELFWRVSDKAILDENNQMTYKGDVIFASDKEEDV